MPASRQPPPDRPVRQHRISLAGHDLEIWGPDPDTLLEARSAEDGEAPYWAELWPSGRALAAWLLAGHAGRIVGRSVLDLGAGLGLGAVAAALAGAIRVVASDVDPEALPYVAGNAARAGVGDRVEVVRLDWCSDSLPTGFDLVLGADVLYDAALVPVLLSAVARTLGPAGTAWIVDPGRRTAEIAPARAREAGLSWRLHARFPVANPQRVQLLSTPPSGETSAPPAAGGIYRVRHLP